MRRTMRGLGAVLIVTLMNGVMATGVLAQPGDDEIAAMYEFRGQLVEEATAVRDQLAEYNEYIKGSEWYVVPTPDSGPVAIDLRRLPDYALAAAFFRRDPELYDQLNDAQSTWDTAFLMAVGTLVDGAARGEDMRAVATSMRSSLSQTENEKRDLYRPTLRFLRQDRDALDAAIDYLDGVIEALGVEPAPASPAEPAIPEPVMSGVGEIDVLYEFRADLEASAAFMRTRLAAIKQYVDDPETAVYGTDSGYDLIRHFDLGRLGAYEAVAEYVARHPEAYDVFDVSHFEDWELPIAVRLLTAFQIRPDDLAKAVDIVRETERQPRQDKKAAYQDLRASLRAERDALDRGIEIMDELIETVAPPMPTPAPTESATDPTPATESPVPNPFADV